MWYILRTLIQRRTARIKLASEASMKKVLFAAALVALSANAAQGAPITYTAALSGLNEIPPVATTGTGSATVTYDPVTHLLGLDINFANLVSPTTTAHIHCCAPQPANNAGVATTTPTFVGFPLGVTSGTYVNTLDLTLASSYNPSFVNNFAGGSLAVAEALLAAGLGNNMAYLNIHTSLNPGGEIRGQIQVPVPDKTATIGLLGIGLVAAVILHAVTLRFS